MKIPTSLTLLALVAVGCHHDPIREMVEKDTAGDTLAVGACSDLSRKLPDALCSRVALHAADRIVASAKPQAFDCDETLSLVDRLAPEKLPSLAAKCCFLEYGGLEAPATAICKRVHPPRPPRPKQPWESTPEARFIHDAITVPLERDQEIPRSAIEMARKFCAQKIEPPIAECPDVLARLPK